MIDNNEIVCLDKKLDEIMNEIPKVVDNNFRDGSRPDIDKLRKLRDKAYEFASDIQNKIDDEIQNANGWNEFVGKYIHVIHDDGDDEDICMHVFETKRLYNGCVLVGDVISRCDDSYFINKRYNMSFINPSDVEIITKEEFYDFVKKTIKKITI